MRKLIPCILLLMLIQADCFRPPCNMGMEGDHGECIIYFKNQEIITEEIDRTLDIYADNIQQILMNITITHTDTAIVRTCATPEMIKANLGSLNIAFTPKPFLCDYLGESWYCYGTSLGGDIQLSWAEKLSGTAFAHELNHWVDELCGVAIDYTHARKDWWSTESLMNKVLEESGL